MIITKELREQKIKELMNQKNYLDSKASSCMLEDEFDSLCEAIASIDYELYCWEELYSQLDGQNINIKEEEWMY